MCRTTSKKLICEPCNLTACEYIYAAPVNPPTACGICKSPLLRPITACTSSHNFCYSCLRAHTLKSSNCPVCDEKIVNTEKENTGLVDVVAGIMVLCPNDGCKKVCTRTEMNEHLLCECKVHPCPHPECQFTGLLLAVIGHKDTCEMRLEPCPYGCAHLVVVCGREAHKMECEAWKLKEKARIEAEASARLREAQRKAEQEREEKRVLYEADVNMMVLDSYGKVKINISGETYETSERVINKYPSSKLAFLFQRVLAEDLEVFTTRDPGVFKMMLNFLATNTVLAPVGMSGSLAFFALHNELKTWGIDVPQGARAPEDLREIALQGFNLSGINFSRCNLSQADLRGCNLEGANLRGAQLRGAIMTGCNLKGVDLSEADFSHAELSNATLPTSRFLKKIKLRGALLCGCDLSGLDLSSADIAEADLTGCRVDAGTQLPRDCSAVCFESVEGFANLDLGSVKNLSRAVLRHHDLSEKDFSGVVITGADLSHTRGMPILPRDLTDVNLSHRDMGGLSLSERILERTDLSYCKNISSLPAELIAVNLDGVSFIERDLSEHKFKDCSFNHAQMPKCKLPESMQGCSFVGANLSGNQLRETALAGCNMRGCDLSGAFLPSDLTGVDLSYANLARVRLASRNLSQTVLHHSNLQHSVLNSVQFPANLSHVSLDSSLLNNAVFPAFTLLANTSLTNCNVENAILPDNINDANTDGTDLSLAKKKKPTK